MRVGEGAVVTVEDGKQAVERVSRDGELPVSSSGPATTRCLYNGRARLIT